ncbi:hypothetical protein SDC9_127949 [bioreactor metagenome]|uniref:Uncharacterized protein n=1 Tax=bioreactor metagenome TaxID=1076179 RepID=A0A645CVM0_9ZZZZ
MATRSILSAILREVEHEKGICARTVRFDTEGKLRPMEIEYDPANRYAVDKRRAACKSVGGAGDRYTCLIRGQERYLWMEKGGWFECSRAYHKVSGLALLFCVGFLCRFDRKKETYCTW